MAELNRLFFALWPTDAVRKACDQAARDLKVRAQPGGYLTSPEKYHITLLFLGDYVPAPIEAAAVAAAARVRSAPFDLTLDHGGSFRNNRAIPWWLGPQESPPALTALYQNLRETLIGAQVTPERMRFVPHLTIVRDAQHALPDTVIKPIPWSVEEFVLVRSHLNRKPATYEIVGRWPLIAGAPAIPPQKSQMSLF